MNRKKISFTFAACVAICFFLCLPTSSAAGNRNFANVSIGSNGIHVQPMGYYNEIVMSIARPDGSVFTKVFPAGETPYFGLSEDGGNISDGVYTYELRFSPQMPKKVRKAGERNLPQKAMVQSGNFTVRGGSILTLSVPEDGLDPPTDVIHYDDVIVTGSLCVGFDCADGESFGFDTIILKEHNLRILFNDTSYTASYPTNSWRITINDSINGGASYFSIDDVDNATSPFRIEADAPSNSLYVEDYGRVGLGTSTPVVELHIKDSDTPTVRLEQDTSGGWTAQTWDVAGNESNFFIRDATNGSKLPFRIQPSTPSSTLCLKSDGFVGVGTWSPDVKFEVETTGEHAVIRATRTDGATGQISAKADKVMIGSYTNHPLSFSINQAPKVHITTAGDVGIGTETATHKLEVYNSAGSNAYCDGGSWVSGSSRDYKNKIRDLDAGDAMDAFRALNPVRFYYNFDKEEENLGFIAEDVPSLVATKDRKGMVAMDVVAVLTKVLQVQEKRMQEQEKTIAELKKEISELKKDNK